MNLSTIITRIKLKIGLLNIVTPFEDLDSVIHNILKEITIPVFSIYYPAKDTMVLNTTELEETSDYIYNALLGLAIMVAIIVAMVLGIQFMAASADEKAEYKERMLPYFIGAVLLFGASNIVKLAYNMFS